MKNKSRFGAEGSMFKVIAIRTSLLVMAICSMGRVAHAQHAQGTGMHGNDGGWMGGWAGGGMWLWLGIGALVLVLLVVVIAKLSKK